MKCVCGGVAEGGVVEDDPEGGGGWRGAEGVGEPGEVRVGVAGVVGAWGAVKAVIVKMLRAGWIREGIREGVAAAGEPLGGSAATRAMAKLRRRRPAAGVNQEAWRGSSAARLSVELGAGWSSRKVERKSWTRGSSKASEGGSWMRRGPSLGMGPALRPAASLEERSGVRRRSC